MHTQGHAEVDDTRTETFVFSLLVRNWTAPSHETDAVCRTCTCVTESLTARRDRTKSTALSHALRISSSARQVQMLSALDTNLLFCSTVQFIASEQENQSLATRESTSLLRNIFPGFHPLILYRHDQPVAILRVLHLQPRGLQRTQ